jgi:hypothetical protein
VIWLWPLSRKTIPVLPKQYWKCFVGTNWKHLHRNGTL